MSGKQKRRGGGTGVRDRVKGLQKEGENGRESSRLKLVEGGEEAPDEAEDALEKHIEKEDAKSKTKAEEEAKPKVEVAKAKLKDGRIEAELADYYAVAINNANQKILTMRKQLFAQAKQLRERDDRMVEMQKELFDLEVKLLDTECEKLKKKHSLTVGMQIVLDDDTGEIYRKLTVPVKAK